MHRDFGKRWDKFPAEWRAALADGDARRLQERFEKEAAEAARRRRAKIDSRPDRERWAWEFSQATAQRAQRQQQAMEWAQLRRTQRRR